MTVSYRLLALLAVADVYAFVPACTRSDATVTGSVRATEIQPRPVLRPDAIETDETMALLTDEASHFHSDELLHQVLADPAIRNHDYLAEAPLSRLRSAVDAHPSERDRLIDVKVTMPDRDLALRVCTALIDAAIRESLGGEPPAPPGSQTNSLQLLERDLTRDIPRVQLEFWRGCR